MSNVRTILYAEDDAYLAGLYVRYFEEAGFRVVHTPVGEAVFSLFKKYDPDVVLLDLVLPGKTGFEAAEEIRQIDKDIPILIITSMTDSETAVESFRIGINDFIRKEYSMDETIARITSQLNRVHSPSNFVKLTSSCLLDIQNQSLIIGQQSFRLPISEYRLLYLLSKRRNEIIDRDSIIEAIWGDEKINAADYLNKTITYLRKYLKQAEGIAIKSYFKRGIKLEIKNKNQ